MEEHKHDSLVLGPVCPRGLIYDRDQKKEVSGEIDRNRIKIHVHAGERKLEVQVRCGEQNG